MKLISIIRKSSTEQLRHFWILLLTVSMAPFFVFIYFLITEVSKPRYDLVIVNLDRGEKSGAMVQGAVVQGEMVQNRGEELVRTLEGLDPDSMAFPFSVTTVASREEASGLLKTKKADAVVVIPAGFSRQLGARIAGSDTSQVRIEFMGDLTSVNYIVTAIWAGEYISQYFFGATGSVNPLVVKETPLGQSGSADDFDLYMPGIIILSTIMLMFSASIAFITEVENKTILRLKLSRMTTFEFLAGVSLVQVVVGILSAILTLGVAVALGFSYHGSIAVILLFIVLTSISVIAFSLIIAAVTKTVTEILIIGNFPMFLFMFFTGAAFPMQGQPLFTLAGYPVSIQGLMSPTHATSALQKVLIYDMKIGDVVPEIVALLLLTLAYFLIGLVAFRHRHMRLK
jgi:ABC-2 type transport system permease protein